MVNFIEQIPQMWKLNDFFVECVSDYLQIKRERVFFSTLWDISIDLSSNRVGIITEESFYPIIKN
jgi:hypothetical protein